MRPVEELTHSLALARGHRAAKCSMGLHSNSIIWSVCEFVTASSGRPSHLLTSMRLACFSGFGSWNADLAANLSLQRGMRFADSVRRARGRLQETLVQRQLECIDEAGPDVRVILGRVVLDREGPDLCRRCRLDIGLVVLVVFQFIHVLGGLQLTDRRPLSSRRRSGEAPSGR